MVVNIPPKGMGPWVKLLYVHLLIDRRKVHDYMIIRHNIQCFRVDLKCIEEDQISQICSLGP